MDNGQAELIKKQLIEQIEKTFPQDKKESAIHQIKIMTNDQLEEFIVKNNLVKGEEKTIFRSIVEGEVDSYLVGENDYAVAVLEINPVSKGHIIIISKVQAKNPEEIADGAKDLAKEIAEKISLVLKPKKIEIINSNVFGEEIINVLPIYEDETISSKRKKASPEELSQTQDSLQRFILKTQDDSKEENETESNNLSSKPQQGGRAGTEESNTNPDLSEASEGGREGPQKDYAWFPKRLP